MPSADTGHVDSPAGDIARVLELARENASRMRVLCGVCIVMVIAILALQTYAILTNPVATKNIATLVIRFTLALLVLGIVAYQWRGQNRTLGSIQSAADDLQAHEERSRLAGLNVAEPLLSADINGDITYFNLAAEKIFGRSSAEVVGRPLTILIPPRFHERHDSGFRQYVETGRSSIIGKTVELVGMRKSGEEFPVEISITHINEGQHNFFTAVVRDITEQKRAEEELRQTEERFRLLIQNVKDYAILTLDASGSVITWNEGAQRIKGYKASEIIGHHFSQFYPPEDLAAKRPERELREAAAKGRYEDTSWRVRKDGSRFWANVVLNALKDTAGDLRGFAQITRDITEQKRSEERFRESEERFRLLIQNVRDYAILALDPAGVVTTWSEGAERIKGYTADEIIGQHFSRFYPQEDIDAGKPAMELQSAAKDGRFEDFGWRVRKDGSRFWANVVVTVLKDDDGEVRGFAKVTRDITDRKRIEDENQKLTDDLEHRNAELAATNRELEAFTYSVAHDLRSPLRHIAGFSKILAEEYGAKMDVEAREYLDDIQQGAARMGALIDDLLNLAKITRQEVNFQIAGLRNIVDNVVKSLGSETKNRDIEWRIDDLPYVECDPTLMTQVYANLLSNAVKYTRPRKPAVIEIGRTEIDGRTVLFVKDNGVGFNMNYADKLFGVFQRLHRSEDFEGTGVGLATVQRIIHKHGGLIWAQAELDKGASFFFTLGSPVGKDDTRDSIAPATFRHAEPGSTTQSNETNANSSEADPNVAPLLNGAESQEQAESDTRERNSLNVR